MRKLTVLFLSILFLSWFSKAQEIHIMACYILSH